MQKIIDYLRSMFCIHELELLDKKDVYSFESYLCHMPAYTERTYMCKKCGYVKKVR